MRPKTFRFESFDFSEPKRTVELRYSLDGTTRFTETFRFDFPFARDFSRAALDRALFGLFVAAGVSYYKTFLPPRIILAANGLAPGQAKFFETLYEHGLGEFFYRNRLKPRRPRFPTTGSVTPKPVRLTDLGGGILPIGGGKDSITSAEILNSQNQPFATWTVGQSARLAPQLRKIGGKHLAIERQISPELLRLNRQGAWNGHVPISMILSFLSVCTAILTKRRDVIWSNEHSANEPNLTYRGLEINHQYSKSLTAERDFQDYVRCYVSPDIRYFSLLRPLTELAVAELFGRHFFARFRNNFSSCNQNFKLHGGQSGLRWCGRCPKCAFVFTILAPFVPRPELLALFGGRNLFSAPSLRPTFEAMLGVRGHKPFECIGEIGEVRAAIQLAKRSGQWPELAVFRFPYSRYNYRRLRNDAMPPEYRRLLDRYLKSHPLTGPAVTVS